MSDNGQLDGELAFHMTLELTEDIAAELEDFILFSRLKLHEEAQRKIDVLQFHVHHYPVFAEIASYYVQTQQLSGLNAVLRITSAFVDDWSTEDKSFFLAIKCYVNDTLEAQVLDVLRSPESLSHSPLFTSALLHTSYNSPTSVHIMELCLSSIIPKNGVRRQIVTYISGQVLSLLSYQQLWESTQMLRILCTITRGYADLDEFSISMIDTINALYLKHISILRRGHLVQKLHLSSTLSSEDVSAAFCILTICNMLLENGVVPHKKLAAAFAADIRILTRHLLEFFGHSVNGNTNFNQQYLSRYEPDSLVLGNISRAILDRPNRQNQPVTPFWMTERNEIELQDILKQTSGDVRQQRRSALKFLAQTGFFANWNDLCTAADTFCEAASNLLTDDSTLLGLSSLDGPVSTVHIMPDATFNPISLSEYALIGITLSYLLAWMIAESLALLMADWQKWVKGTRPVELIASGAVFMLLCSVSMAYVYLIFGKSIASFAPLHASKSSMPVPISHKSMHRGPHSTGHRE